MLKVFLPTLRGLLDNQKLRYYDLPTGARERRLIRISRAAIQEFLANYEQPPS
jgi:hypothetical protein